MPQKRLNTYESPDLKQTKKRETNPSSPLHPLGAICL